MNIRTKRMFMQNREVLVAALSHAVMLKWQKNSTLISARDTAHKDNILTPFQTLYAEEIYLLLQMTVNKLVPNLC